MSSESVLHRSQTELGIHFTVSATKSGIMSKSSRYPSTGIKSGTMSIGESAYATVSAANSFAYQGVSFFSWQETLPVHLFSFFLIFLSLCRRLFCYYVIIFDICKLAPPHIYLGEVQRFYYSISLSVSAILILSILSLIGRAEISDIRAIMTIVTR